MEAARPAWGLDAAAVCWGVLALLHAPPALALARPRLLVELYGVPRGTATPLLLLRHRAALFAGVAAASAVAALQPHARLLAGVVVGNSMCSFLWLWATSGRPEELRKIALADLAGLPLLTYACWQAWAVP
jgi:hypothetical protein